MRIDPAARGTLLACLALGVAAEAGHAPIVDTLLARGADRTIADKSGKRAADLAASEDLRVQLGAR